MIWVSAIIELRRPWSIVFKQTLDIEYKGSGKTLILDKGLNGVIEKQHLFLLEKS